MHVCGTCTILLISLGSCIDIMNAGCNTILSACPLSLSLSSPSGEFITFIRASKVNLVARMRGAFTIYFTPYENIFDEFYGYLETGVTSGNLCEIEEKFTKVRSVCCGGGGGGKKMVREGMYCLSRQCVSQCGVNQMLSSFISIGKEVD